MWRQKPVGFEQWINKKSHREKSGKSGGLVVRRTGFCCAECARYVSADCPTESMSLLAGYCKSPLRCNNLNNNFFRALIRHHLFTMKRNALFGASLSVNLALCANSGAVLVVPNYADQISRSENKWIHPVYQNWAQQLMLRKNSVTCSTGTGIWWGPIDLRHLRTWRPSIFPSSGPVQMCPHSWKR